MLFDRVCGEREVFFAPFPPTPPYTPFGIRGLAYFQEQCCSPSSLTSVTDWLHLSLWWWLHVRFSHYTSSVIHIGTYVLNWCCKLFGSSPWLARSRLLRPRLNSRHSLLLSLAGLSRPHGIRHTYIFHRLIVRFTHQGCGLLWEYRCLEPTCPIDAP